MVPLGEQHRRALVIAHPRRIAAASVGEVGSEQDVQTEISQRALERHKTDALEHHVAPGIGQDLLLNAITTIDSRVSNPISKNTRRYLGRLRTRIPLFLREERLSIGHDETKVARACVIDTWVVDLIEDPVAQREPDAAVAADSGTEAALRTRRPAGRTSRPARGEILCQYLTHRSVLLVSREAIDGPATHGS